MKPFTMKLSEIGIENRLPILNCENSVCMKSGEVVLKKGEEIGCHNTGRKEELIVVLEGNAKVEINNNFFERVESGSVIYFPPSTLHNIKNTDEEILRYIYITAPVQ